MALFPGLFQTRLSRFLTATALLTGLWLGSQPPPAQAGCGCDKPPPELAAVRPNATYAGMELSVRHSALQTGQLYTSLNVTDVHLPRTSKAQALRGE